MSNPHQHPLIYLRGIEKPELKAILQFIYMGTTSIVKDRMENLMLAAEKLKIKGLYEPPIESKDTTDFMPDKIAIKKEVLEKNCVENMLVPECELGFSSEIQGNEDTETLPSEVKKEKLDGPSENDQISKKEKEEEVTDLRYKCGDCDYQSKVKNCVKLHRESIHEGVRYSCPMCDYNATKTRNLRTHIEAIHEKVRYNCDQCEYAATQRSSLKRHKKGVHKNPVVGPYIEAHRRNLKPSNISIPESEKYPCDQCDYAATQRSTLNRHIRGIHKKSLKQEPLDDQSEEGEVDSSVSNINDNLDLELD